MLGDDNLNPNMSMLTSKNINTHIATPKPTAFNIFIKYLI